MGSGSVSFQFVRSKEESLHRRAEEDWGTFFDGKRCLKYMVCLRVLLLPDEMEEK